MLESPLSLRLSLVSRYLELQELVLGKLPLLVTSICSFSPLFSCRCPTECRLKYSPHGKWNCVVKIRTITDSVGQSLGQARNELFGEVIYDKDEVEERIRRAQRAILHPHISRQLVLIGDDETDDGKGLTFSSNCVSLEISGPDVADLSFCDLPGGVYLLSLKSTIDCVKRSHQVHLGQRGNCERHPACPGTGGVLYQEA